MHAAQVVASGDDARNRAATRVHRAFWVVLIPALVTVVASRWLVPAIGSGVPGFVAEIARDEPLLPEAALFVAFSLIARYWHPPSAFALATVRSPRTNLLLWVVWLTAACAGAMAFRAFVARPYRIDGASMLPTLAPGDLVAGTIVRGASKIFARRGEVIVFGTAGLVTSSGATPTSLVKRVIGLPGDRIEMRGGAPVINGWPVPSCDAGEYLYVPSEEGERAVHGRLRVEFLGDATYLTVHSLSAPFVESYLVPAGEVFVLGDDRGNSVDSRHFGAGHGRGVPVEAVESTVARFLVGTHRNGDADLTRILRPLDTLAVHLRLEGIDTLPLDEGIARCLAHRPASTPPEPTL